MSEPGTEVYANMDDVIAVGFGVAQVTHNGEEIFDGERIFKSAESDDDLLTFRKAETAAAANPDGTWEVLLLAPLGMQKFRREAPDRWRLVEAGKGFA